MPDTEPPQYLGDPNPAVAFTIQFQDGALLRWVFDQPWDQMAMFWAIGELGRKHELGITFDLPEPDSPDL